jgi:hypothetical protein
MCSSFDFCVFLYTLWALEKVPDTASDSVSQDKQSLDFRIVQADNFKAGDGRSSHSAFLGKLGLCQPSLAPKLFKSVHAFTSFRVLLFT